VNLPILYSFRRCPYAIRARLALKYCGAQYLHREILLKDKPKHMLKVSSKGTVPVLVLPADVSCNGFTTEELESNSGTANCQVIDESIEIMRWAMCENQSRHTANSNEWIVCHPMSIEEINTLIEQNDFEFKSQVDKYKYSIRYPEHPQAFYLEQALPFLEKLEDILSNSPYLGGSQFRFSDAAILPFVRQFSMVEPKEFNALPLPKLQQWLVNSLESDLFLSVMHKFPQWKAQNPQRTS